jgi:phage terminase large subunit
MVGDVFWIVDEYLKNEATTADHASAFAELCGRWGVETIFIDSAAAQFASDLAYIYDLASTKAKKDVLPGIAYVQTLVAQGRLKVAPHCTHCLAVFDQYRWDTKEGLQRERPKHDDYSHMADAIRYALYTYTL